MIFNILNGKIFKLSLLSQIVEIMIFHLGELKHYKKGKTADSINKTCRKVSTI